jgi:hypothetical protein
MPAATEYSENRPVALAKAAVKVMKKLDRRCQSLGTPAQGQGLSDSAAHPVAEIGEA